MHVLCAASRACETIAWDPNAWENVLVDTGTLRPQGLRARMHFKLWTQAYVIHGLWVHEHEEIATDSLRVWQFEQHVLVGSHSVLSVSSLLSAPSICFKYDLNWNDICLGFAASNNVEDILDALSFRRWRRECMWKYPPPPPPPPPRISISDIDIYVGDHRGEPDDALESGLAKVDIVGPRISMRAVRATRQRSESECTAVALE